MLSLKKVLWKNVHGSSKKIEQIANEMGVSKEIVYRWCLESTSGADMPLKRLVDLTMVTKRKDVLRTVAAQCNCFLVRYPRRGANRLEKTAMINNYQQDCNNAVSLLLKWVNFGDDNTAIRLQRALRKVSEESYSIEKRVNNTNQLELAL